MKERIGPYAILLAFSIAALVALRNANETKRESRRIESLRYYREQAQRFEPSPEVA